MASRNDDPALDALMLPFAQGLLAWPQGPVLFLRAREGAAWRRFPLQGLTCVQGSRPAAQRLEQGGLRVVADGEELDPQARFPLVLVLPPRQREEARALMAQAVRLAAPGGSVVAAMPNNEGARSGEADLKQLAGLGGALTKYHCRTFWTRPLGAEVDAALCGAWAALDAPREIAPGVLSRPGVFAWDRVDAASALLAGHLPRDLRGAAADLGAGWGYLSMALLDASPGITSVDLYEAEARALALARDNLGALDTAAQRGFHWHDVTTGLPAGQRYDVIVSNPPFHAQGRDGLPAIGQRFIEVAAQALRPRGRLLMVPTRHLPYELALAQGFAQVRTLAERNGFKAIEAIKA